MEARRPKNEEIEQHKVSLTNAHRKIFIVKEKAVTSNKTIKIPINLKYPNSTIMKKIITLLAVVLFSSSSFAQDLTDQFYFRLGYSSPSWKQYGMEKDDFKGISKTGATFELGSIFML